MDSEVFFVSLFLSFCVVFGCSARKRETPGGGSGEGGGGLVSMSNR